MNKEKTKKEKRMELYNSIINPHKSQIDYVLQNISLRDPPYIYLKNEKFCSRYVIKYAVDSYIKKYNKKLSCIVKNCKMLTTNGYYIKYFKITIYYGIPYIFTLV